MSRRRRFRRYRWMINVPPSHDHLDGKLYERGTPEHARAREGSTSWANCSCHPTGRRAFREFERCPPGAILERVQYRKRGPHKAKVWVKR